MVVLLQDSTHDTLKAAGESAEHIWGVLIHFPLGSIPGGSAGVDHNHDLVVDGVVVEGI